MPVCTTDKLYYICIRVLNDYKNKLDSKYIPPARSKVIYSFWALKKFHFTLVLVIRLFKYFFQLIMLILMLI